MTELAAYHVPKGPINATALNYTHSMSKDKDPLLP